MTDLQELEKGLGPLRVGTRSDLEFSRHVLRGEARYVVHDPVSFKNHVFDILEYQILSRIVPTKTLNEVFHSLVQSGDLEKGDKQEFLEFVLSLNARSILNLPVRDAAELHRRERRKKRARRSGILRYAVYWKISLLDPDKFLDRTATWFGWAYGRIGLALWGILVVVAVAKCWGRFGEMFASTTNLLSLSNIPVLYVALIVLKVIHEFGHAYACKRMGCAVPEMGVVFIFAAPCAYVDASASWKLPSRWQRIAIAMGGMYVESAVAAIAALVWAGTQSGLAHDIAVNVIVLASVVTLLFNINPLMRFDGYYVFTDLLGTPNLYERSRTFIVQRVKRLFLGLPYPAQNLASRERVLYSTYGVAAVLYKFFLALAIVSMVLMTWPLAGTVLGIALAYVMLVQPVARLMRYLLVHPETQPIRGHAQLLAVSIVPAAGVLLACLPVSWRVVAPGVLQPEQTVVLRAPADGVIEEIPLLEGATLTQGQSVAYLSNPRLDLEANKARKLLRAERLRLAAAELTDPGAVPVHEIKVHSLVAQLAAIEQRLAGMRLAAPLDGRLIARHAQVGGFVREGSAVVEIHGGNPLIRMVLTDEEFERSGVGVGDTLRLRWSVSPRAETTGRVLRILPSASRDDVPQELTVLGGGEIYGTAAMSATGLHASRAYLHVLIRPSSLPMDRTAGLTARIDVPARLETVGSWLLRRLAGFYNSWRLT